MIFISDHNEEGQSMAWGTFGVAHIATLVFAVVLNIALYFILKKCSQKTQVTVLGILSFWGIAAIIYNLFPLDSALEYLPLHLCSFNAMILPFAVFTRNKVIGNLTLLWSLGAAMALILNHSIAHAEIGGHIFCFYYFPHVFEASIPILLFKLGLCKLDAKCIRSTIGISATVYTAVHLTNLAINEYCKNNNIVDRAGNIIDVNYMYSMAPDNPLLDLFYDWIPQPFWYMLPVIPIVLIYLGAIYGIAALVKKKKTA